MAPAPSIVTPVLDPDVEVEEQEDEQVVEELAPLYRVIGHDDPITTMDFVVQILRGVFHLPQATAVERMLCIHYTGAALIGRYPESTARRRVARATRLARASGFPLTFTIERDE